MMLSVCLCDDTICLMAEPSSKLTVLLQDFFRRMEFLAIACAMSGNLRRTRALSSNLLQVFFDLDSTRTRCLQILLRISLDLWLPMLTAFDLIAEALQPHRKFGSVYRRRILLRLEQAALLQRARLSILSFGHIEDHSVSVKLWCSIAVYGTCGVMLKRSGSKLTGCLWRMNVTNASLCVSFQLLQCHADAFAVRFTHAIIATHKGRKRNRLGCGERRVPPCTMFELVICLPY